MGKPTGPCGVAIGLLALVLSIAGPVFASGNGVVEDTIIEGVEVQTRIVGFPLPPPLFEERINRAVKLVATTALVGRNIDEVTTFHQEFTASLTEVLNAAVTGYQLEHLELAPGRVSLLEAIFKPQGKRIELVEASWSLGENQPDWVMQKLDEQLNPVLLQLDQVYQGVPLDAFSWAGAALLEQAKQKLPLVPGFQLTLQVEPAQETKLVVLAIPQEPRVYSIEVDSISRSLSPAVQRQFHSQLRREVNLIKGVPVQFVKSELDYVQRLLEQRLTATVPVKDAGLSYRVALRLAAATKAQIQIESSVYQLFLEGIVNFGSELQPGLCLEAGRYVTPGAWAVGVLDIPATNLNFEPQIGLGTKVFQGDLILLYSLREQAPELRFDYQLSHDQRLRFRRTWAGAPWELAYGIKNADYLTTEIVGSPTGIWLRLVGNL